MRYNPGMMNPNDDYEMEYPDINEDLGEPDGPDWPEWEGPEPDYGRDWYEI